MSRRKKNYVERPEGEYRVRIYCDHGDKHPRADVAVWLDGKWSLQFGEFSAEHDSYRIECRGCRNRIAANGNRLRPFLDTLRGAGVHAVSMQAMSARSLYFRRVGEQAND